MLLLSRCQAVNCHCSKQRTVRCRLCAWSLHAGDPFRKFEQNREYVTVASLAQGTHGATAAKQASCPGSISAAVFHATIIASCKPARRERVLCWPELCLLPAWLVCLLACCYLTSQACLLAGQAVASLLACLLNGKPGLLDCSLAVVIATAIYRGSFAEVPRKACGSPASC